MLELLNTYDWEQAFGYAGNISKPEHVDTPVSLEPFTREDVSEILHTSEGENDGPNWIMVGQLNDGRFFFLSAGCDYTGWDCQASGESQVSGTYGDIIRWSLSDEDRQRFGIIL